MTTAHWLQIPPSRVLVCSLISRQPIDETLLDGPDTSHCGDPLPHAVLWDGALEISDGNHRIARARRRGQDTLLVRVAVPFVHFIPFRCAA